MKWVLRAGLLAIFAFFVLGPIGNLVIWSVAEQWFWPNRLPSQWGFRFWEVVFRPTGRAMESLWLSIWIALLTTAVCLVVSVPAGYALARGKLPWRPIVMLIFLLPQAFPNLPVYINIARIFFEYDLNGTVAGVVMVHAVHGLVFSVWIATAAFAAIDPELEQAARNIGASGPRTFFEVTLPLALPGIVASAIFVFLESLDEFTGSYFVGAPEIRTLPLMLYSAGAGGNIQIAAISALILLVPSILFMLLVERFLKGEVLAKMGR
ncbi:MAG: spermidine/putrescine ABC transporter permease [Tagaea sp. CACIAM 22H2]|jgi:ABC-type spermidine/putrescine transport system permease subunit II|nr:spermidine/putrescine ABC transporter permease [Tagaea sp. CACIAM 22H2]